MDPRDPALSDEDAALLDRVAARVVELRLEVPALVTLESSRPLSVLAGQAMLFFQPFVQAMFRLPDYQRFAALIERRETIVSLIQRIEARADAAHTARRARRTTPGKP
jgi:hypothetical protein